MSSTEFNYQAAINKAKELDDISSALRTMSSAEIADTFTKLQSFWSGGSANVFLQKGSQLCEKVSIRSASCESIANDIRSMAVTMQEESGGGIIPPPDVK